MYMYLLLSLSILDLLDLFSFLFYFIFNYMYNRGEKRHVIKFTLYGRSHSRSYSITIDIISLYGTICSETKSVLHG